MKKVLSVLLAVILVSAMSITASAVEYVDPHINDAYDWENYSGVVSEGGKLVVLQEDVTFTESESRYVEVTNYTLDLNGHTLTIPNGIIHCYKNMHIKNGSIIGTVQAHRNPAKLENMSMSRFRSGWEGNIETYGNVTLGVVEWGCSAEGSIIVTDASTLTLTDFAKNTNILGGQTITVNEGGTLVTNGFTLAEGCTLTNNGTVRNIGTFQNEGIVQSNGSFQNEGTIQNNGMFYGPDGFANSGEGVYLGNPIAIESFSHDVMGTFQSGTPDGLVFSVDIEWGAMEFTYNEGSSGIWKPETHSYDSPSLAGWSSTTNTIQITNHSNSALTAGLSYASEAAYSSITAGYTETSGTVDDGVLELASAEGTAYESAPNATATVNLIGELTEGTTNAKIGSITVTLHAVV